MLSKTFLDIISISFDLIGLIVLFWDYFYLSSKRKEYNGDERWIKIRDKVYSSTSIILMTTVTTITLMISITSILTPKPINISLNVVLYILNLIIFAYYGCDLFLTKKYDREM